MTVAALTSRTLTGSAFDGRTWTWAYVGRDAQLGRRWPALTGTTTGPVLVQTGFAALGAPTAGVRAEGAGSTRLNWAVQGQESIRYLSSATYPSPAANPVHVRLVLREPRIVGVANYLELSQAAQAFRIRRSGTDLLFDATESGVTFTAQIDIAPFLGSYREPQTFMLLDVVFNSPAGAFTVFLNGVDLSPVLDVAGGAFTAFAGLATLALMNRVAGGAPAYATSLLFAGLRTVTDGLSFALEDHREDADALGLREDGLATNGWMESVLDEGYPEVSTLTLWAWSGIYLDETTLPAATLLGEPIAGDTEARLTLSAGDSTRAGDGFQGDLETAGLLREGLRSTRLGQAFSVVDALSRIGRGSPSGLPAITGSLHARLIFRVSSDLAATQRLFFVEDGTSPTTIRFGITVETDGDLVLSAPGYTATVAAAVAFDRWHLLDVVLDRTGGPGGVAIFLANLDGNALVVAAHSSTVIDIPADASVTLFDDVAHAGAATSSALAFVGLVVGGTMPFDRHVLDALALGVYT